MSLKTKNIKSNSQFFSTEKKTVIGILNITTDSFYDGGRYLTEEKIIQQCGKMLKAGAKIIDLGASTFLYQFNKFSDISFVFALFPSLIDFFRFLIL